MAAIIKSEDQDSWGEGTAGSSSNGVLVKALGDVKCRYATHKCQGVMHCERVPVAWLNRVTRYEPSDDEMREYWSATNVQNVQQQSSAYTIAAQ